MTSSIPSQHERRPGGPAYAGYVRTDPRRPGGLAVGVVTLRSAVLADLPVLSRLIDGHPLFARYALTPAGLARGLRTGLVAGDTVMVARAADEPVGMAWSVPHGAFGRMPYLQLLVVARSAVGHGIGGRLMDDYEDAAFLRARYAFLLVTVGNDDALRFYARRGYEVVGRLDGHVHPEVDEWVLRKRRPGADGPA